jgi:hypothetical protein
MVDLPESAGWHPLKAARFYEVRAEEAAGRAVEAFTSYASLRAEFRAEERIADPKKSLIVIDTLWSANSEAKKCVSDLATYSNLAQMYAAMASMKHTRYLSDRALWAEESLSTSEL